MSANNVQSCVRHVTVLADDAQNAPDIDGVRATGLTTVYLTANCVISTKEFLKIPHISFNTVKSALKTLSF